MSSTPARVALVTGAANGIGRAVAEAMAGRGLEVHALDRDEAGLATLATSHGCIAHAGDVRDLALLEQLASELPVEVLVSNAGVLPAIGPLHESRADDVDHLLDVNLRACVHLARLFLPGMVARNRGHLFMFGSTVGLVPHPNVAVYAATKAAIHMLCGALRSELVGRNVRITEIAPGRVQTGIYNGALGGAEAAVRQLYENFDAIQPAEIAQLLVMALELPEHVDIRLLEVTPTMQATGGGTTIKKD